ncbi:NlpC/P60 family protein [Streptomyces leeuwenhoekii]|uniref:C40 family peptidase n=1 Tax=Streptomyces leeuwenhoekii TaxID=1437453 RepID=UPI00370152B8
MASHRRPRQRASGGGTARTAVAIALTGAATAAGFGGTGHAEPERAPAQVRAEVERLYREAEVATESYNGAREKAERAERRLAQLQDAAARRQERLASARAVLGTAAAAQYRGGGLGPAVQLALSEDPDAYLEGAALAERMGSRQAAAVARVRGQLREIERLRGAARVEVTELRSRRAELERHRATISGKLDAARRLLSELPAEDRAGLGAPGPASRSAAGTRESVPAPGAVRAPDARAAAAVAYAHRKIGSPYVWGATGPDAFDCSGLVQAAYRAAGVALPRTTYAQIGAGRRVSRAELLPGDLVFFYSGISHVGIYVGNGRMIHAPNPSAPVRSSPIDQMPFAGATRVV